MKNTLNALRIASITMMIAACSAGTSGDKAAELEKLKSKEAELKLKIAALEKEVKYGDAMQTGKVKMVAITEMQRQPFAHYVEVQGTVIGDEDVMVSAQFMGTVTDVLVKAGDKVSKGQLLATIDDRTIRQNIESLKAQYELAATVYARQKNLWDQKIGSEIQYLNAKTQKESLEKQLAALQEQWDMTRIKSPINGTVDEVNIKTGQTVAPGFPSVRVVNLDNLKVRAEVAESFINSVKKGNEVIIYFPGMNTEIKSTLDYAGRAINPLNRTFNVEVRLKKSDGTFYPNQVAVLKIADYSSESAFVVPVSAVQKTADGEYVFLAIQSKGNRHEAKRRSVKTGKYYNGKVEITSGIEAGERVITFGSQNLVDGDPIAF
jgi:RND family efflux transporter MFP subunit